MVNEALFKDFYLNVHDAAETMQDDWEKRWVPSPSSVSSCRLKQWFQASGITPSNRIPVDSMKKMESGRVIEDFWREVYTRAGYLVVSPLPSFELGDMKSKGGDGLLFVEDQRAIDSTGLPKGSSLLLELKDLGAWTWCDFTQKGIKDGMPDYYDQVQTYLHAYDREWCVFHAGMADASGTKFIWNRIKKIPAPCPPFWVEMVKRDPNHTMKVMHRASEVRNHIDNITDRIPVELRDYDVATLLPKKGFPCGYCGWSEVCLSGRIPSDTPDNVIAINAIVAKELG